MPADVGDVGGLLAGANLWAAEGATKEGREDAEIQEASEQRNDADDGENEAGGVFDDEQAQGDEDDAGDDAGDATGG